MCLLLSVVCGMCGLGGEDTDPGDPNDIIEGEVTEDEGECIPGECINGGEGCDEDDIDCMPEL